MQRVLAVTLLFFVVIAAHASLSGASGDLYGSYSAVHRALVTQSASGAAAAARMLADRARDAHQIEIAMLAETIARADDLDAARQGFATLSDAMIVYRNARGDRHPAVAWCGMVRRSWLQLDGPIANPYLGPAMVSCGEIRSH